MRSREVGELQGATWGAPGIIGARGILQEKPSGAFLTAWRGFILWLVLFERIMT